MLMLGIFIDLLVFCFYNRALELIILSISNSYIMAVEIICELWRVDYLIKGGQTWYNYLIPPTSV